MTELAKTVEPAEDEAARRGVSVAFVRAERAQLTRQRLGRPIRQPITKKKLVQTGQSYWPVTYAKAPGYDQALQAFVQTIEDSVKLETAPERMEGLLSVLEALEVPDSHIHLMGAARWLDQGFPVVVLGERYAAALMSTSVPSEIMSAVNPPWKAFLIEIPPVGLTICSQGEEDEIRRIFVWADQQDAQGGAIGWGYFTMCDHSSLTLWGMHEIAKMVEQDVVEPSEWDGLPFGLPQDDRDHRIRLLIHRLILNTCLAMSRPENVKPVGSVHSRPWTGPTSRTLREPPTFRHFQLGQPVQIDCRQSVRDYVQGSRTKSSMNVQVMVRGHWKQQPHGPARSLRKVIWVEPYWKGEGPVLVRPHNLGL